MPRTRNPEAARVEADYKSKKRSINSQINSASQGSTKRDLNSETLKLVRTKAKGFLKKAGKQSLDTMPVLSAVGGAASAITKHVTKPPKAPKATGAGKRMREQPTVAAAKPTSSRAANQGSLPKRPDNYVSAADKKLLEGNPTKKKRKAPTYRG